MKQYLLIDIGGTFIKYSLTDAHAQKVSGGKVPTPLTGMDDLLALQPHGKASLRAVPFPCRAALIPNAA